MDKEDFVEKANKLHNNKYDYSETNNIKTRNVIYFKCLTCGKQLHQYCCDHLKGKEPLCDCVIKKQLLNKIKQLKYNYNYTITEDNKIKCLKHNHIFSYRKKDCIICIREQKFFSFLKKKYNFDFDFEKMTYKDSKSDLIIYCKKHGSFTIKQESLSKGCGCKKCLEEKITEKITKQHKEKLKNKYRDKYDFIGDFFNKENLIECICKKCNKMEKVKLKTLLYKNKRCGFCDYLKQIDENIFLERAKEKFGKNKYEYNLKELKNTHSIIKVKCLKHNYWFEQNAFSHLQGHGCKLCCESTGERKIRVFLENKNIKYEYEKVFSDLKDKNLLSYDFYLPEYNLLIEYNGEQHYSFQNDFHKTIHDFHRQLHHDWLKRKYAKNNNIKLLVISYLDNIEEILKEELD